MGGTVVAKGREVISLGRDNVAMKIELENRCGELEVLRGELEAVSLGRLPNTFWQSTSEEIRLGAVADAIVQALTSGCGREGVGRTVAEALGFARSQIKYNPKPASRTYASSHTLEPSMHTHHALTQMCGGGAG